MDEEYSDIVNEPLMSKMLTIRTPRRPPHHLPKDTPPIKAKVLSGEAYNHTLVSHTRNNSKDKASFAFPKAKRFSE